MTNVVGSSMSTSERIVRLLPDKDTGNREKGIRVGGSIRPGNTITWRKRSVIPGFGFALGYSLSYLALIVLIPLSTLVFRSAGMTTEDFRAAVTAPGVLASYRLTFGVSLAAAFFNALFGVLTAWGLTRYSFPGKRLIDALVDLPFALPTAVAGITLAAVYGPEGWIGQMLERCGVKVAYTPLGIFVAMTFIGLPFVVRTVQPVLQDAGREREETAACLGANRWQTFCRIILPPLLPAILTGFALAFARAVGEYGSVIFIAGNIPMVSEITPLVIMTKLEQYDYNGAAAIASVMLAASFCILLAINLLQWWSRRYEEG